MKILLLLLFPIFCRSQEMSLKAGYVETDTSYSASGVISGETKNVSFRDMIFHNHMLTVYMRSKVGNKPVIVTILNSLGEKIFMDSIRLRIGLNAFTFESNFSPGEYEIKVRE